MVSVKKFRKLLFVKCNNQLTIYDGTFYKYLRYQNACTVGEK